MELSGLFTGRIVRRFDDDINRTISVTPADSDADITIFEIDPAIDLARPVSLTTIAAL
jgi:hypothetical protein